jgi:hypothetical protein
MPLLPRSLFVLIDQEGARRRPRLYTPSRSAYSVGAGKDSPKMSELPNVGRQACWGAGFGVAGFD